MLAVITAVTLGVVPVFSGQINLNRIAVDTSLGDQFDPHIDGYWISWSSVTGVDQSIRYQKVGIPPFLAIPGVIVSGQPSSDLLSDTSQGRIAFTRVIPLYRSAIEVFDGVSLTTTEVNPQPGSNRIGVSISGNTIVYSDLAVAANGTGEILVTDMTTNATVRLTNDLVHDQNPVISPNGQLIVWEHCVTNIFDCGVEIAVNTGSGWTVSTLTTNGSSTPKVTNARVAFTGTTGSSDVTISDTSGNRFTVEFPGDDSNPSFAGNYVVFQHWDATNPNADLYLYSIIDNRVFQLTNTPLYNEGLSDLQQLPNGDLQLIWDLNDEDGINRNIYMATFMPPPANPIITHLIPPTIHAPSSITVDATSPSGAIVTYTATATDIANPNPSIVCTPPSGALFPLGITVVSCTATNMWGRQAQQNITVTVRDAAHMALDLGPMIASFNIESGFKNSLQSKVQVLSTDLSNGKMNPGCNDINATMQAIRAQTGKKLTVVQANQLMTELTKVAAAAGCP